MFMQISRGSPPKIKERKDQRKEKRSNVLEQIFFDVKKQRRQGQWPKSDASIRISISISTFISACMHVYVYAYKCIYVYIYIYPCAHSSTHILKHTHGSWTGCCNTGEDGLKEKSDRAHIWVWAQNFQESLRTHKTTSKPAVRKCVVE